MTQKTKTIILIILIILATVGIGGYFIQRGGMVNLKSGNIQQTKSENNTDSQSRKEIIIQGKVLTIAEKQISIEMENKSTVTVNINPSVPVFVEGADNVGNLSILKKDAYVSISADGNNNVLFITIKK